MLTNGSPAFHPSSFLKNCITVWNRFDDVILYKFCFMIGAFPTALKRTTTYIETRVRIQAACSRLSGDSPLFFPGSFFLYVSRASRASCMLNRETTDHVHAAEGDAGDTGALVPLAAQGH